MLRRLLCVWIIVSFLATLITVPRAYADPVSPAGGELLGLPQPGTMVDLSPAFEPVLIKGLKVHPENPFLFDFIIDPGDNSLPLKREVTKLIKYFLASLTIPDKDLWVNLSPYEKNRMIADNLGQTEMGRDMLAEDYILKQLTASLIYPEKNLGRTFWDAIYSKAQQMYGTTQIPVNTFNKVWIVADRADVFERGNVAYVVGAHLKVMLEEDYLALSKHQRQPGDMASAVSPSTLPSELGLNTKAPQGNNRTHNIASNIIRRIILPQIEKEVNTGKNFAPLRQMFYSMILASWYKMALKDALLTRIYGNQSKVKVGINLRDPHVNEEIFQRYLMAYKKGVFNYIKDDINQVTREPLPRKYFSGGTSFANLDSPAMLHRVHTTEGTSFPDRALIATVNTFPEADAAQQTPPLITEALDEFPEIFESLIKRDTKTAHEILNLLSLYRQTFNSSSITDLEKQVIFPMQRAMMKFSAEFLTHGHLGESDDDGRALSRAWSIIGALDAIAQVRDILDERPKHIVAWESIHRNNIVNLAFSNSYNYVFWYMVLHVREEPPLGRREFSIIIGKDHVSADDSFDEQLYKGHLVALKLISMAKKKGYQESVVKDKLYPLIWSVARHYGLVQADAAMMPAIDPFLESFMDMNSTESERFIRGRELGFLYSNLYLGLKKIIDDQGKKDLHQKAAKSLKIVNTVLGREMNDTFYYFSLNTGARDDIFPYLSRERKVDIYLGLYRRFKMPAFYDFEDRLEKSGFKNEPVREYGNLSVIFIDGQLHFYLGKDAKRELIGAEIAGDIGENHWIWDKPVQRVDWRNEESLDIYQSGEKAATIDLKSLNDKLSHKSAAMTAYDEKFAKVSTAILLSEFKYLEGVFKDKSQPEQFRVLAAKALLEHPSSGGKEKEEFLNQVVQNGLIQDPETAVIAASGLLNSSLKDINELRTSYELLVYYVENVPGEVQFYNVIAAGALLHYFAVNKSRNLDHIWEKAEDLLDKEARKQKMDKLKVLAISALLDYSSVLGRINNKQEQRFIMSVDHTYPLEARIIAAGAVHNATFLRAVFINPENPQMPSLPVTDYLVKYFDQYFYSKLSTKGKKLTRAAMWGLFGLLVFGSAYMDVYVDQPTEVRSSQGRANPYKVSDPRIEIITVISGKSTDFVFLTVNQKLTVGQVKTIYVGIKRFEVEIADNSNVFDPNSETKWSSMSDDTLVDTDETVRLTVHKEDKASVADQVTRGGIDFNRSHMQMNITREGQGVQMQFDPAMIARIKRDGFDGLDFQIKSIMTVSNLPRFLGLKASEL